MPDGKQGLGLRAAAKALGISHVALLKAERNGRVQKLADGGFDVDACRLELQKNSHPQKQKAARAQQRPAPTLQEPPEPDLVDELIDEETDEGKLGYTEVLRRRELVRLHTDQLNLDRKRAELVPLGEINAWFAGELIRFRDVLLGMGGELGDRVAQESDPARCRELITEEMKRALRELAEYRPSSS